MELDAHLFRREAARLLAILTRAFGVEHLALAEDVVQETLTHAFEVWRYSGVPDHYAALLTTSAKHRVIDAFRRRRTARRLESELGRFVESEWTLRPAVEEIFGSSLEDDQVRMMFTCCRPQLHEDVQVALVLKILCGFDVEEIAAAFLTTEAATTKRLFRGKRSLAEAKRLFELTDADFAERLSSVQRALYLLFNEGYHGACAEVPVRAELCHEAMRLVHMLLGSAPSATSSTYALAALMSLHAARLPARIDDAGDLTALVEQDRSRWDARLVTDGLALLERASGDTITVYHLEAGIAGLHAAAISVADTRWGDIVWLYDALMRLRPSPVVELNRAMAIAQRDGPRAGLDAIAAITDVERLAGYVFYPAALGELECRIGHLEQAAAQFRAARVLARNESERRFLDRRIADCSNSKSST